MRLMFPSWGCVDRDLKESVASIPGSAVMTNIPAPALTIQHPPDRSKFRELAGMLSREDDPPEWLCRFFEDWAPCLLVDRGVHLIQPTRKEMRRRLAQVSTAVDTLIGALNDSATAGFLDHAGTESAKYTGMAAALLDVKKRAADAKSASLAKLRQSELAARRHAKTRKTASDDAAIGAAAARGGGAVAVGAGLRPRSRVDRPATGSERPSSVMMSK
jgi:hypothetical protein